MTTTIPSPNHSTSGLIRPLVAQVGGLGETNVDVVLGVELVDERHLRVVAKRAPADGVACFRITARQVVLAEVVADRREVVVGALDDRARRNAAIGAPYDPVVVRLGILARVHEIGLLDAGKVPTVGEHRFQEEHRTLLDLANARLELGTLAIDLHHLAKSVHPDKRLLCGVDRRDVVVVPRDVASLVGRDGRLDVCAGEARDHQVHHVSDGRLPPVAFHVARVLLRAHLVLTEQVAQRDRVGQIHAHARRGSRIRRNGRKRDVLLRHADRDRVRAVDGVLDEQLRHDLPRLDRCGIGVVGTVDLEHVGARHDLLGLGRVHETAVHVDVAVQHVVLRVLVRAVHALLGEHDRDLGAGHAAHVAVEVDGPADLVLDEIERPPSSPHLLARDGDAPDTLRRALQQPVDVALSGGADDHHVVGAVPGGHAHAPDVVLEAARRDLGRDHAVRLRVDVVEVVSRRERNAPVERCRGLQVGELVRTLVGHRLAPGPPAPPRAVVLDAVE